MSNCASLPMQFLIGCRWRQILQTCESWVDSCSCYVYMALKDFGRSKCLEPSFFAVCATSETAQRKYSNRSNHATCSIFAHQHDRQTAGLKWKLGTWELEIQFILPCRIAQFLRFRARACDRFWALEMMLADVVSRAISVHWCRTHFDLIVSRFDEVSTGPLQLRNCKEAKSTS